MYYHLDIEQQLKTILKKFEKSDLLSENNANDLKDISDGQIYKNLLNSEDGQLFKDGRALSFLINTDGISFCKKSKLAIWPVYMVINELPLHLRYSIENVILAGKLITFSHLI